MKQILRFGTVTQQVNNFVEGLVSSPLYLTAAVLRPVLCAAFVLLTCFPLTASHYKGGNLSYRYLGEGRYEILIKGYWDKDAVDTIVPRYEGSPKLETPVMSVSQKLLPDGLTIERVQRQVVKWSSPGLYEVSWRSCCRAVGENFSENEIGLFAVVHYSTSATSSPQFLDNPIFNFKHGEPVFFSMGMLGPEGREQEFSLEIPYGLPSDAYQKMLDTGFDVSADGAFSWKNPQAGTWLVNVKLKEKVEGVYTGAYIMRDFLIKVAPCELPALTYSIVSKPCQASGNGKVSLSATQGVAPFLYSLDGGVTYQSSPDFEGLTAGSYTGLVVDGRGCVSPHAPITLDEVPLPLADAGADTAVYYGYDPLSCTTLTAGATEGTAPYTYRWSTGETSQAIQVCPTVTTTYQLFVTDAKGCISTDEVTVTVHDVRSDPTDSKHEKVIVCKNEKRMDVKQKHVEQEMEKGATLGNCDLAASNTQVSSLSASSVSNLEANGMPGEYVTSVSLYPNPIVSGSQVTLSCNEAGSVTVELLDLSGRIVRQLYHGYVELNQELSMSCGEGLKGGRVYVVRVSSPKGVSHHKLMVL